MKGPVRLRSDQLLLDEGHPALQRPEFDVDRRLPHAHEAGPLSGHRVPHFVPGARHLVPQLGQLDLEFCFCRLGPSREDVQDEPLPVDYLGAHDRRELVGLGGRDRLIDYQRLGTVPADHVSQLLGLADAYPIVRFHYLLLRHHVHHGIPCGLRQFEYLLLREVVRV